MAKKVHQVSSFAYKEVRNHNFILTTSKKLSWWKKSTTLLGSVREVRKQGKLLFQDWRDRWIQGVMA